MTETDPAHPRRVLLTADTVGGIWTYALDLARGLSGHGVRVVLVTLGPKPRPMQLAAAAGVPGLVVRALEQPLDWMARSEEELRRAATAVAELAARSDVDLVHLHSPALGIVRFPVPIVAGCHSCLLTWWRAMRDTAPPPADFLWRAGMVAAGLDAARLRIAPTAAFAQTTARAYALADPPVVVHNGRQRPPPRPPAPRRDTVLTAGRLWDEGKDVATLDRAAQLLPSVAVLAAGPSRGPNGVVLATRHLRLLGALDAASLQHRLSRAGIFVSCARYEPFGLAVLEAAQAGCALVISDIPSFRELWHGAAAFFPPGDAQALAETVRRLRQAPRARQDLAEAALARARLYSLEAMTAGTLRTYADALRREHASLSRAAA